MTSIVLALLSAIILGIFVIRRIHSNAPVGLLLSEGVLVGIAIPAAALFVMSMCGLKWNLATLAGICLAGVSVVALTSRRQAAQPPVESPRPARRVLGVHLLIDLVTVALLIGYGTFSTMGPVAEYDFIVIWGLKAQTFLLAQGIDWSFLTGPWREFTHPDYPILLPLTFDYLALSMKRWDDSSFGLLYVCFCGATLLLVRSALVEESGSHTFAAIGTLALTSAAASPYIGLAEAPMIAYSSSGLILIRRSLLREDNSSLSVGAIMLGLAASSKNEGLTLVIASLAGLVIAAGFSRSLLRYWPALAIPLPWLILRSVHSVPTDLATGNVFSRLWSHLQEPGIFFESIMRYPLGRPLFWTGLVIALIVTIRRSVRRERFLVASLALQYGFYIAAYLATPHDVDWHFKWSWERVINQMTVPLTFLALTSIAPYVLRFSPEKIEDPPEGKVTRTADS